MSTCGLGYVGKVGQCITTSILCSFFTVFVSYLRQLTSLAMAAPVSDCADTCVQFPWYLLVASLMAVR